jgi:hypothetical protein
MGQYLTSNIVEKITVSKEGEEEGDDEKIKDILSKELNLGKYYFTEDKDNYYWELKEGYLAGDKIRSFLEDQFKMYGNNEMKEEELKKISCAKTAKDIKDMAEDKFSPNFQKSTENNYLYVDSSRRRIYVKYDVIIYLIQGKIIMECYNDILRYFSKAIQLQKEKHEIADCTKVMITG